MRPDAKLPTRQALADVLLDKAYESLKEKTEHYLENSADWICLCSDGWTNVKGEPVVNYMAASSLGSFILERINTGAQSHNAEWISRDIMRVIDKTSAKVAGVVTDNTNTNKGAWTILRQKYPKKFFYGCVAHTLNLLVNDIFNISSKQKKDKEYPFEYLVNIGEECKELVKVFLNQHVLKAKLEELQKRDGKQCLVRPAPTRWGTLHGCIDKIIKSEGLIRLIVTGGDFKNVPKAERPKRDAIFNIVTRDYWLEQLRKCFSILDPINKYLVKFQKDSVPLSEVYECFESLPFEF